MTVRGTVRTVADRVRKRERVPPSPPNKQKIPFGYFLFVFCVKGFDCVGIDLTIQNESEIPLAKNPKATI